MVEEDPKRTNDAVLLAAVGGGVAALIVCLVLARILVEHSNLPLRVREVYSTPQKPTIPLSELVAGHLDSDENRVTGTPMRQEGLVFMDI